MPSFRTVRRVRHRPDQMFDLVADCERYPEFVPLCEALKVRRRIAGGEGVESVVADMTVGYKRIHETFTSRATFDRPRMRIHVEYLDGPFRHLDNVWLFKSAAEGAHTDVDFSIAYEFRSRALGLVMGAMFDQAFRKFAEAFERRADLIYGLRPLAGATGS